VRGPCADLWVRAGCDGAREWCSGYALPVQRCSGCALAVTHSERTAPTSGGVSECGVDVREGCAYVFGRAVSTVLLV